MAFEIVQVLCQKDNYVVLLHDADSRATACIDAPEAAPILAVLDAKGWKLTDILVTHHHADHVQGIPALRARFPGARVTGPCKEAAKIGGLDVEVGEGDTVKVGGLSASVIETPGHTVGQINYFFAREKLLFSGDTLFALGCGRVFETPLEVMWHSLAKLAALPADTQVYCGHEYTQSNARFALSVEPDNAMLQARARHVDALRAHGNATVPSTIELELATNPFLRANTLEMQKALGMSGADPAKVFAELRTRKDKF
jgi:hydroxyacylglutathione hydrolase